MSAFWLLWLLIFYGCLGLRYVMDGWFVDLGKQVMTKLPVIGEVTPVVIFCYFVIPGLVAFVLIRKLNSPRIADFLIDTENELKKVAWPTKDETISASIVVIFTVLILAAFLFVSDELLGVFFDRVLR